MKPAEARGTPASCDHPADRSRFFVQTYAHTRVWECEHFACIWVNAGKIGAGNVRRTGRLVHLGEE